MVIGKLTVTEKHCQRPMVTEKLIQKPTDFEKLTDFG